LLRGAGRDVALEQLTFVERALLANLRAYHQYRQGFYTQVAIGELGVAGPQRGGGGTVIAGFSGQGSVGGYIGLLQQLQRKRNTEDNLSLQERTLARLVAFKEAQALALKPRDEAKVQDPESTKPLGSPGAGTKSKLPGNANKQTSKPQGLKPKQVDSQSTKI
jgi:hypothetical protein